MLSPILTIPDTGEHSWLVLASMVKYSLLFFVTYRLTRRQAAYYLDDLFELKDEKLAVAFIEDIAFGDGDTRITITGGKILKEDERSPTVLIGGPGQILVHLGNVAVVETAQGTPKIISTSSQPWDMEGFERIREIGQYDETGKREYAIVNLRDQFVRELDVSARTKDSIHIEIRGIKMIFSILRDQTHKKAQDQERNPFTYNDDAILSLIYEQAVITHQNATTTSIKFPWETTVIPLVISELEKMIQSHTLSEILASTGEKEVDEVAAKEKELKQMRGEVIIEHDKIQEGNERPPSGFIPRTTITENFFGTAFRQKAAKLGISIEWIDIGTWEINHKPILEKLNEAREMSIKNAKHEKDIAKNEKKLTFDQILDLIIKVVVTNFKQVNFPSKLNTSEWKKLAETIRNNPELSDSYLARQLYQQMLNDKVSQSRALEIIKAFHTELLAAKELINADIKSPIDRATALHKINNALQSIGEHIYHFTGR